MPCAASVFAPASFIGLDQTRPDRKADDAKPGDSNVVSTDMLKFVVQMADSAPLRFEYFSHFAGPGHSAILAPLSYASISQNSETTV